MIYQGETYDELKTRLIEVDAMDFELNIPNRLLKTFDEKVMETLTDEISIEDRYNVAKSVRCVVKLFGFEIKICE